MPVIGVVSGLTFANDVNAAFDAIRSMFSGSSAPSADTPIEGQCWLDTSTTPHTIKQYTGSVWAIRGWIDTSTGVFIPHVAGGGIASLASGATVNLGAASTPQGSVDITGTTTITSFGSSANLTIGQLFFIRFSGALTLTYNAGSLIIPGAANLSVSAGDCIVVRYEGSGNWRVLAYQPSAYATPPVPTVHALGLDAYYALTHSALGGL